MFRSLLDNNLYARSQIMVERFRQHSATFVEDDDELDNLEPDEIARLYGGSERDYYEYLL